MTTKTPRTPQPRVQLYLPKDQRVILPERKTKLARRLTGKSAGYKFVIKRMDTKPEGDKNVGEAMTYAADFAEVFKAAGWKPKVEIDNKVFSEVRLTAIPNDPVGSFVMQCFLAWDIGIAVKWWDAPETAEWQKKIQLSVGEWRLT